MDKGYIYIRGDTWIKVIYIYIRGDIWIMFTEIRCDIWIMFTDIRDDIWIMFTDIRVIYAQCVQRLGVIYG